MKNLAFVSLLLASLTLQGVAFAENNTDKNKDSNKHEPHAAICARDSKKDSDEARCHARVIVDAGGAPKATILPSGYGPAQLRGAYNVSGLATSIQTIAIVDAYDHPSILSDLNTYSDTYGIPRLSNCAVATGTLAQPCFQKVNQRGGSSAPAQNAGWALEIALDVEAAHAMCQNCNILLVEADSNSFSNLLAAEDRAALMGAKVISNSWGASEFSGQTSAGYDGHFNKPGVAITVSSGDSGYGTEYPASSQYVTAVGGTTLNLTPTNSRQSETAWTGAGSGCSLYESKPLWQTDSLCSKRTVSDVSAVADPNTGAAVYDSVRYQGRKGWYKVGGTSLAAPVVASLYALAGNVSASLPANQIPYINRSTLYDVTTGSNGSCGGNYLCTAMLGYDGPTGLGAPNGLAAY